jgi:hypothetical protein
VKLDVEGRLLAAGFSCPALELDEARELRQRVRDAFPDVRGDYPSWEACDRGEYRARTGSKAAYQYEALGPGPWFVLQRLARRDGSTVLRVDGPSAPPYHHFAQRDCEVIPVDLSWLFVTSHEDVGPFLIRRATDRESEP